ncbi:MAG TPA: DUF3054 domain-containing protein [Marmoricola sp.]|nr:DUF3054 domain-containing protein [Marmoricola sp.]
MTLRRSRPALRSLLPLLADVACLAAFALAGKTSHEAGASDWVVLAIAWPYVLSASLAHVWFSLRGGSPQRVWPEGTLVVAVTYVLGMALRVASGRGIAVAFLVVAALFLSLTMLGWRAVVTAAARLSRRRRGSPWPRRRSRTPPP